MRGIEVALGVGAGAFAAGIIVIGVHSESAPTMLAGLILLALAWGLDEVGDD